MPKITFKVQAMHVQRLVGETRLLSTIALTGQLDDSAGRKVLDGYQKQLSGAMASLPETAALGKARQLHDAAKATMAAAAVARAACAEKRSDLARSGDINGSIEQGEKLATLRAREEAIAEHVGILAGQVEEAEKRAKAARENAEFTVWNETNATAVVARQEALDAALKAAVAHLEKFISLDTAVEALRGMSPVEKRLREERDRPVQPQSNPGTPTSRQKELAAKYGQLQFSR